MTLTEEQIQEFRAIYKEKFGKELSNERAHTDAPRFLRLMQIVYQPMTYEDAAAVARRRKELGLPALQNKETQ